MPLRFFSRTAPCVARMRCPASDWYLQEVVENQRLPMVHLTMLATVLIHCTVQLEMQGEHCS